MTKLLSLGILLQVIFFAGGWVFFMKKLFRDYEVHHHTVQLIFSVTFALSCIMFELIIFEILGVLDAGYVVELQITIIHSIGSTNVLQNSSYRFVCWNIALITMLIFVIIVIPFYIGYFIVSNIWFGRSYRVFAKSDQINLFFNSKKNLHQTSVLFCVDVFPLLFLESWRSISCN